MLKGRLSRKWAIIQEGFYRDHPNFKHCRTRTGLGWTIRMIKEFIAMLLDMWKSRCGCLHGHTRVEEKRKQREEIGEKVRKCYGRRGEIVIEHQDIFQQAVEEMINTRSPHYLRAWINMFYSLVLLSDRIRSRRGPSEEEEVESVATFDTIDLAEYLVDATDGMDREWDIEEQGAVQTPPEYVEVEEVHPRCRVRNPYKKAGGTT